MTMRITPFIITVAIIGGLSGCGSTPVGTPDQTHAAHGTGYLKDGPTVTMDSSPPKNTTLEMLDAKIREHALLKARIESAAAAQAKAEKRAAQAEESAGVQLRRVEELERLLAMQAEDNRGLMDELLKARIMRLRVEREMLKTRLADLASEKQ